MGIELTEPAENTIQLRIENAKASELQAIIKPLLEKIEGAVVSFRDTQDKTDPYINMQLSPEADKATVKEKIKACLEGVEEKIAGYRRQQEATHEDRNKSWGDMIRDAIKSSDRSPGS